VDDIHHATKATIAALATATTIIDGSTTGGRPRNRKAIGGIATADKNTIAVISGHSVWATDATVDLFRCCIAMMSPQRLEPPKFQIG
jgi:hypothetical protein